MGNHGCWLRRVKPSVSGNPGAVHFSYSLVKPANGTTKSSLIDGKIKSVPEHVIRYGVTSYPFDAASLSLWGRTFGVSNINKDVLTGDTTLRYSTVFDLAATYDWKDWELQLIVMNLFDQSYSVGDAGSARPLPRMGTTVELAATFTY